MNASLIDEKIGIGLDRPMIKLLILLFPFYLFSHTHSPDHRENSYTYDPFFLDVLTNHMKKEKEYFSLAKSRSKNKKLNDLVVKSLRSNDKAIKKMQDWKTTMYKEVEKMEQEKFDLKPLKDAKSSEFEKKMSEKLKELFAEGKQIATRGQEENFEQPIKAFAGEMTKIYSERMNVIKNLHSGK